MHSYMFFVLCVDMLSIEIVMHRDYDIDEFGSTNLHEHTVLYRERKKTQRKYIYELKSTSENYQFIKQLSNQFKSF